MVGRTGSELQEGPGCLNPRGGGRGAFGPQREAALSSPACLQLGPGAVPCCLSTLWEHGEAEAPP